MSNIKLTIMQKKIILIVASVLVLLGTYMFVYQRNMDTVTEVETANSKLENQVNYLQSLQTKVTELEQQSQEKETEMNDYLDCFAPKITLEKCIYYIYMMSVDSEIKVTSIEPGNEEKFFDTGKIVNGADTSATPEKEKKTQEETVIEKKKIGQMVGKKARYTVGLTGSYDNVMGALDWIRDHDENMSLGATTLAYDSGTGELSGTIEIMFYSMQGNGATYEEPDLSGFSFGEDNIFGTFLNDNASDSADSDDETE